MHKKSNEGVQDAQQLSPFAPVSAPKVDLPKGESSRGTDPEFRTTSFSVNRETFEDNPIERIRSARAQLREGAEFSSAQVYGLLELRPLRVKIADGDRRRGVGDIARELLIAIAGSGGAASQTLAEYALIQAQDLEGAPVPFLQTLLGTAIQALPADSKLIDITDRWLSKRIKGDLEAHNPTAVQDYKYLIQSAVDVEEALPTRLLETSRMLECALKPTRQPTLTFLLQEGYSWLSRFDSKDHISFAAMVAGSTAGTITGILVSAVATVPVAALAPAAGSIVGIIGGFFAVQRLDEIHQISLHSAEFRRQLVDILTRDQRSTK